MLIFVDPVNSLLRFLFHPDFHQNKDTCICAWKYIYSFYVILHVAFVITFFATERADITSGITGGHHSYMISVINTDKAASYTVC